MFRTFCHNIHQTSAGKDWWREGMVWNRKRNYYSEIVQKIITASKNNDGKTFDVFCKSEKEKNIRDGLKSSSIIRSPQTLYKQADINLTANLVQEAYGTQKSRSTILTSQQCLDHEHSSSSASFTNPRTQQVLVHSKLWRTAYFLHSMNTFMCFTLLKRDILGSDIIGYI